MSEKLERNKYYLNLLITTHPSQVKALLVSANPAQLECLVEIAYNLVDSPDFDSLYHREKKLLEFLANLSISLKRKKPILVEHSLFLRKVLKKFSPHFLKE